MSQVAKPKFREYSRHLLVCTGERCTLNGEGQALFDSLQHKLRTAGLGVDAGPLRVKRTRTGCVAACKGGPILGVQPDGTWYYNVTDENMDRIIESHLKNGKVVDELVFHQGKPSCTEEASG
ncbi:(2Fe-2S) ferredoxin domain-containing protein [Dechloromonas sp. TW-R-39-2]|uniref:(2Fe-2S) ferredoxin domain-containing protein n=1 Tax=Dechloromonas sp. TW-R-39-2 TaxID=2654218 RepID=UPI00193DD165|nr:NAD(P)H-dependent oxidoreductase subunit E [Dechloromonas sp. TW-R-39-2]QRM20258.1 (2Fe-2S) ferredoxin domain-containing protein [Dechloromonas sp. TW-R-39-2]